MVYGKADKNAIGKQAAVASKEIGHPEAKLKDLRLLFGYLVEVRRALDPKKSYRQPQILRRSPRRPPQDDSVTWAQACNWIRDCYPPIRQANRWRMQLSISTLGVPRIERRISP